MKRKSEKQKKLIKVMLITVLIGVVISVVSGFILIYSRIDTRYAVNYSESQFNRIENGMSKKDVLNLVGEPLSRSTYDGEEIWRYSTQGDDKRANYYGRFVFFDRDSLVMRVDREIYVD